MRFRNLFLLTMGLCLSACRSDPPAKTPEPPEVPIAKVTPVPPVQPVEKPVKKITPPPKNDWETTPTPLTKEKTPPEKEPKEKEPAKKVEEPTDISKDPKVTPKDVKEQPKEPKFVEPKAVLGRGYDAWRADIKSKDPSQREKAMKMILNFGPDKAYEALPDILAEMNKHNKSLPIDMSFRVNGIVAISTILFNKKEPEKKILDEAIPVYKLALKDRQVILRTRAVQGVLSLGPRAQDLIDDIISVAHDTTTGDVRKEGIISLTRVSVNADKKVHPKAPVELRKGIDDASGQVRVAALQGLIALAPAFDAKEKQLTVDKVNALLKKKDTDPFMQMLGHVTIMNVTGKVDKASLDPLINILKDKDDTHRLQALQFIKLFGPKAQSAIDDVLALSTSAEGWQMRKEALMTAMLLAYDKNGLHPSLLPGLRAALNDKTPEVRQAALTGLTAAKIGMDKNDIKTTVAAVSKHLKTEKEALLEILGNATIMTLLGDINAANMEPIVDMLKHKDREVRMESLRAISLAGKKAKVIALPAVLQAVRDADLAISIGAIETLPNIHAFEAMDLLKTIAADKKSDPAVVEAAQDALTALTELRAAENAKNAKANDKTEKK